MASYGDPATLKLSCVLYIPGRLTQCRQRARCEECIPFRQGIREQLGEVEGLVQYDLPLTLLRRGGVLEGVEFQITPLASPTCGPYKLQTVISLAAPYIPLLRCAKLPSSTL